MKNERKRKLGLYFYPFKTSLVHVFELDKRSTAFFLVKK